MSKFTGTWQDPSQFLVTIAPQADGTVAINYEPKAHRPAAFIGTEEDPTIAAPTIAVNFTDDPHGNQLVGTLTDTVDGGQEIHWSNSTVWVRKSTEVEDFHHHATA